MKNSIEGEIARIDREDFHLLSTEREREMCAGKERTLSTPVSIHEIGWQIPTNECVRMHHRALSEISLLIQQSI